MAVERDRNGRPKLDGKWHTRASRLAELLDDRHQLEHWGRRMVAAGLVATPDLVTEAAGLNPREHREQLNHICDRALTAAKHDEAANLGTAIHLACELADRGQPHSDLFAGHVAAYRQALEQAGVTVHPDYIERLLSDPDRRIAGTPDRIVRVEGADLPVILDIKTGRSTAYSQPAWATQMAIYAASTLAWDDDGVEHEPKIDVDTGRAIIAHIPQDANPVRCELHWLDISEAAHAVDQALWVRRWRNRKLLAPIDYPARTALERGGLVRTVNQHLDTIRPPAEQWAPDEGRTLDADDAAAKLRAGLDNLGITAGTELELQLIRWVDEARQAGRPFRLTPNASERRYEIYRLAAHLLVAAQGDDTEAADRLATTDPTLRADTVGAALSFISTPAQAVNALTKLKG